MPKAEDIIARMETLEGDRSNWDTLYQDCADYGLPGDNQIKRKEAGGQERSDTFQTIAENSIIQLAAGLYSYMFPTDTKAFVLRIDDEKLSEKDDVKSWLDKVTSLIHEHLVQSNFRQAFFEFLKQLACFGTACQYEEKGKTQPLNFICYHIAGIFISLDSDRNVDTVFRSFELTARQAVQEFGIDNLPEKIKEAYNKPKQKENKFRFIHAVMPRKDYDPSKDDPLSMPFVSIYVARKDKSIVEESGYPEMPYQVSFFDRDALETYGRSPMMKMLPDVRMIGQMKKTRIKSWDKMCDPTAILPDDGSIWPLATQPGGVIYKRPGGDSPEWFEYKGNLQGMQEAIAEVRSEIRAGFFLDLFDALIDRQNMTATEVMARVEQKMRLLVHIIGRLQSNYFNPMIHRVMGILHRQQKKNEDGTVSSLLPEMPEVLSEKEVRIEYLGRLALTLKTLESEGFVKTMTELKAMADLDPEAPPTYMDNFDKDIISREMSRNNGMPSTWLKDITKRDQDRKDRAEAAKAEAMMDRAPDLAKAAKNLSTKPEDGSITQEVIDAAA